MIAGTSPQDVTRDVLANGGDIRRSAFAKGESGYAVLTGYSHLMKVTMRIIEMCIRDSYNTDTASLL